MSALLVVDVQNDFLPGGALAVPEGDEVIARINALMSQYRLVVACRDWHPPDHMSFKPKGPWPPHCVQNTKGADFSPKLNTGKIAKVFSKGSDPQKEAYSAFAGTDLANYLRKENIQKLDIVGLATDYCVKASALDAVKEGFQVRVIKEGCKGIADVGPVYQELENHGIALI